MRFLCWKENLGVGLGALEAESPGRVSSAQAPGSEASWDSVLRGRMVCSPACHWTYVLLARDPKQLASGKGLPSCTAKHLTMEQAVQCRHACNHRLQMQVHWRNHFLVLKSCFRRESWAFPFCLAKSKSFFFKRKALEAGLLSSLANVTNALPVFWVFKNFLDLGTWLLIWLGDRTINSPGF